MKTFFLVITSGLLIGIIMNARSRKTVQDAPAPEPTAAASTPLPLITAARTPAPTPELAPPGIFYLTEPARIVTSSGVTGLPPGSRVQLLHGETYLAEAGEVRLSPYMVTNDIARALRILEADQGTQQSLRSALAADAIRAREIESARQAQEAVAIQKVVAAQVIPKATPWQPRLKTLDRPGKIAAQTTKAPSGLTGSLLDAGGEKFGGEPGLPWPIEGHLFTLTEVNDYKKPLRDKVVKISIAASPDDNVHESNGAVKVFASDARADGTHVDNYSFVEFPPEAADKLRVMQTTGPLSFYVRVDAKQLTAVGRSRNIDSFSRTFTYTW